MSKIVPVTVTNGQNISAINSNFTAIATHLNSLVSYRQNPVGEPNEMHNDVDYNGFRILNLGQLNVTSLVVNGISVDAAIAQTAANAAAAAASATNANTSAINAANSAASAAATLASSLLKANNLSDVNNVATARSNLGLGTAALNNTGDFLQTANNLSDVVAATARTNLGLTSAATTAIGTSGATIPLLSTANTWTLGQTYSSSTVHSTGLAIDNTVVSAARNITYRTSGSLRWNLSTDAIAESGSNAGSNYSISRYNDAGTFIDTPLTITRSSGQVAIKGGIGTVVASAGFVGEILTGTSSGLSLVSNTAQAPASVSLTAGTWDIQASVRYNIAAGCTVTAAAATASNASTGGLSLSQSTLQSGISATSTIGVIYVNSPVLRVNISTTTTHYANSFATFSGGTCTADGFIRATRVL
jgi:hypothetical protein